MREMSQRQGRESHRPLIIDLLQAALEQLDERLGEAEAASRAWLGSVCLSASGARA